MPSARSCCRANAWLRPFAAAAVPVHADVQLRSAGRVAVDGHGTLRYRAEAGLRPAADPRGRDRPTAGVGVLRRLQRPGRRRRDAAAHLPVERRPRLEFRAVAHGRRPARLDAAARLPDWTPAQSERPLVDNADSWLGASDLVFVDAVGTGYAAQRRPGTCPRCTPRMAMRKWSPRRSGST
ncbi:hypothetical protein [Xanthomonas theicola]|uniref:Uncharacterized protein n=1 Tax=Xanthomonas theicola TaxID=56464 RepID=A0A2S6ZJ91_9XANT|nr:hypothetical protein [Xanthomonas theicola]PPT92321.1 hypothetical protein XthCFBP4691_04330 [Xanthomonas theicola]QNH23658.1 hypothetical protein G4Q83_01195 [Xanthomonas theicola]